jgi:hypothetical protein
VAFVKIPTKKEKITMKTRMKRLVSISTIPVFVLALLLVLGTVLADDAAIKPAPSLSCTIDYVWDVLNGGWSGTISGDIEGVILWPSVDPPPPPKFVGQTNHYVGGFEIWDIDPALYPDDAVLLLAGDGAGSTTVRHGRNSVWRSNGIVTGAGDGFEDWIGRRVHQGGHFTWQVIETPNGPVTIPDYGTGTFRIN